MQTLNTFIRVLLLPVWFLLITQTVAAQPALVNAVRQLDRDTEWQEVAQVQVNFDTYHPQGFALVDGHLFVSSVEVTSPTRRFASLQNGLDRSSGAGKGHLFKMDLQGNLLAHLEIGEGAIYHPGGIDYDGASIWVPVAEYRPNSKSIVYRLDPVSLDVVDVFSYDDHIGGIVHNIDDQMLHGISWGSRRFYGWVLDEHLEVTNAGVPPAELQVLNPSHYIDYQDCQYASQGFTICTGLATYQQNKSRFKLGGIELIDLRKGIPVHQAPFPFWTETGKPLTQNPVAFEVDEGVLRLYAMPEDNDSRLFIYETNVEE